MQLAYPQPVVNVDLTYRPGVASGGATRLKLGGRAKTIAVKRGGRFVVHGKPGTKVTLRAGAGKDRYGNANANALSFRLN